MSEFVLAAPSRLHMLDHLCCKNSLAQMPLKPFIDPENVSPDATLVTERPVNAILQRDLSPNSRKLQDRGWIPPSNSPNTMG